MTFDDVNRGSIALVAPRCHAPVSVLLAFKQVAPEDLEVTVEGTIVAVILEEAVPVVALEREAGDGRAPESGLVRALVALGTDGRREGGRRAGEDRREGEESMEYREHYLNRFQRSVGDPKEGTPRARRLRYDTGRVGTRRT